MSGNISVSFSDISWDDVQIWCERGPNFILDATYNMYLERQMPLSLQKGWSNLCFTTAWACTAIRIAKAGVIVDSVVIWKAFGMVLSSCLIGISLILRVEDHSAFPCYETENNMQKGCSLSLGMGELTFPCIKKWLSPDSDAGFRHLLDRECIWQNSW